MIDMIRKRKVDFNDYPHTEELFELLINFPPILDYDSQLLIKTQTFGYGITN